MSVETSNATETQATSQASAQAPASQGDEFAQALAASNNAAAAPETAAAAGGTPTPQASPAASAAPTQPSFRDLFKDSGLDVSQFKTDQELRDAILNERRQLTQYAQVGYRYAPHAAAFDQFLQQQPKGDATPAAKPADPNAFDLKKHFADQWKVPAWNPQWDWLVKNNLVELDDRGLYAPAPGAEAIVAPHLAALNEHRQQHAEQVQQWLRGNPYEAIHSALLPAFEQRVQEMFEQRFGQHQQQSQQQTALQQFESKYASVLFDQAGQATPDGQRLNSLAVPLIERGWPEHEAYQWAADAMGLKPAAAPAPQAALAPTPEQKSGAQVESFIDQARRNASTQSNAAPYAHTPAPLVNGEVELDQMFAIAARQAS